MYFVERLLAACLPWNGAAERPRPSHPTAIRNVAGCWLALSGTYSQRQLELLLASDERTSYPICEDGPASPAAQPIYSLACQPGPTEASSPIEHWPAKRAGTLRTARGLVRTDRCRHLSYCCPGAWSWLPPR